MKKPNYPACERNRGPILKVLKEIISPENKALLEIGSGSGQHAVYFAPEFPQLQWITSDVLGNQMGIASWLKEAKVKNIHGPEVFEVGKDEFPRQPFDTVFTANTFHIMGWKQVKSLFKMFGTRLREGAQVIIYGPFNYDGKFTSESNERFDASLKERDPKSGIRSFEDVKSNMEKNGFSFTHDYEMPANNRILLFTKLPRL